MLNILFVNCAYSDSQTDLFLVKSKRGYQYAAQNFQRSLIEGFLMTDDAHLTVLSIPSLSTFPQGNNLIRIESNPFIFKGEAIGHSFGYINLPLINQLHQSRIDKYIDLWHEETFGCRCIVVYAMLKQQMQYAVAAKKRHPDIKLCIIIPDLPMYMACNKYYKLLGLQKLDIRTINNMLLSFDCSVVLAEPMVIQLNIANKPYAVIEGIYCDTNELGERITAPLQKTIMYAGGIVSRYGVFDLIEAFHRIEGDEYQLILCGPCPEMEKLNSYISSDSRIQYKGLLPTHEVRRLQKQVSLLVNPRHSTEEFTKYSFPSKTLEYMASGTPVLMSPLPSMPKEYYEHVYLFTDESIDGMSSSIVKVLSLSNEILMEKGRQAASFIVEKKNPRVQTEKIIKLING